MSKSLPIRLIEQQRWLENLAGNVQPAVRDLLDNLGDEVKDLLHGKWLGHPLHPVLTDIPVGAWTAALVIDAVELMSGNESVGDAADIAVGVGLAGAVGAAVTGATDWSETEGRARTVGIAHALLNVAATGLYATSLAMRRSGSRRAGMASRSSATHSRRRPHTSADISSSARASASRARARTNGRSGSCRASRSRPGIAGSYEAKRQRRGPRETPASDPA